MVDQKPKSDADLETEPPTVVVRDRRRVDPVTGARRSPATAAGEPAEPGHAADLAKPETSADEQELKKQLDERTADLQRITAEYANYRKRIDRERELMAEQSVGMVVAGLLPVLDDIERAREHGDLTGGFATVAEQFITILGKMGLTGFAEPGDVFDPTWHEAVAHTSSDGDSEPHVTKVLRRGYALGERMLRPALVVVGDPVPSTEPAAPANQQSTVEGMPNPPAPA